MVCLYYLPEMKKIFTIQSLYLDIPNHSNASDWYSKGIAAEKSIGLCRDYQPGDKCCLVFMSGNSPKIEFFEGLLGALVVLHGSSCLEDFEVTVGSGCNLGFILRVKVLFNDFRYGLTCA